MSKTVAYSVVERKNPAKAQEAPKFYAQAQAQGAVTLSDMSERIEEKCTLHAADVLATLKALESELKDSLERGEIVRLGDIGSFRMSLHSKGAESREEFGAHLITGARILFRPTRIMMNYLAGLHYEKVTRRGYADIVLVPVDPEDGGTGGDGSESVDPLG